MRPAGQGSSPVSGYSSGIVCRGFENLRAPGSDQGGRLADRKGPVAALKIIFAGLALVLLALTFTAGSKWLVALTALA